MEPQIEHEDVAGPPGLRGQHVGVGGWLVRMKECPKQNNRPRGMNPGGWGEGVWGCPLARRNGGGGRGRADPGVWGEGWRTALTPERRWGGGWAVSVVAMTPGGGSDGLRGGRLRLYECS